MRVIENGSETPFYFESRSGKRLFGIMHSPTGESKKHGFVFCHPLAEEKLWAHRAQVNLARKLAHEGYAVLRFDFYGEGDSAGEFEQSTVETRLEDVQGAIECLKKIDLEIREVSLFGLRFGGMIAAITAERLNGISSLILWEPVLEGSRYIQEMLRTQLAVQLAAWGEIRKDRVALANDLLAGETANIDGYLLAPEFYSELVKLRINDEREFTGNCLIVQIRDRANTVADEYRQLATAYASGNCVSAGDRPFWRETREFCPAATIATEQSVLWLDDPAHA